MIAQASSKFVRISPTKVRQVCDLIRDKDAREAEVILVHINRRPKEFLIKILRSAIANAKVKGFGAEQLYVSKIICDGGPSWKRYRARAFGRASGIKKRTSHIKIELDIKNKV